MIAELSEQPVFLEYVDAITETFINPFIHSFIHSHSTPLCNIHHTSITNLQVYRDGGSSIFAFKESHEIRK